MDFDHFLADRRPRWQRLTELLDRVDAKGLDSLNSREADEFFSLYRRTSSDLNLVQTRTANPGLLDYLEDLVARAYAQLLAPRQASFFRSWWDILRNRFPLALRSEWRLLSASALALVLGTLCGFAATFVRPATADVFLPAEHLQESPRDRVARLEDMERNGNHRITSADEHAMFTVFLFNNNIRVSVLAFALGITFGVGTIIMLFYNGAMLGSLAALYALDGQTKFFIAWVGPHGALELPCVIFAGTAGLMLAARQLNRREGGLLVQVRAARTKLTDLLIGTATLLVIAGCIEGGFSQINEPTISYWFKIAVATALFCALVVYVFIMPVRSEADGGGRSSLLSSSKDPVSK
jgi:uncharacterized membrane protein SpoIIM required for sporulation